MIREIIRPTDEYINIKVPQEYVGHEIEVLIFSSSEISKREKKQSTKELLEEFEMISKNPIKVDPNIDRIKLDEDMNDVIL